MLLRKYFPTMSESWNRKGIVRPRASPETPQPVPKSLTTCCTALFSPPGHSSLPLLSSLLDQWQEHLPRLPPSKEIFKFRFPTFQRSGTLGPERRDPKTSLLDVHTWLAPFLGCLTSTRSPNILLWTLPLKERWGQWLRIVPCTFSCVHVENFSSRAGLDLASS